MKARAQHLEKSEVLKKADSIIKKFSVNIHCPVTVLRQLLIDAYPMENQQAMGIFAVPNSKMASERELVKQIMSTVSKFKNNNEKILKHILLYINDNISAIASNNKLRTLFAAYFSIFQQYRRFLSLDACDVFICVDIWRMSLDRYLSGMLGELQNSDELEDRVSQLRAVFDLSYLMPQGSDRRAIVLNSLVSVMRTYYGESLDEFVCENKDCFSISQRATIAMNFWNRCRMISDDTKEKSLKAFSFFINDIDENEKESVRQELIRNIQSVILPPSIKAESVKCLCALLGSLSVEDRSITIDFLINLVSHHDELVRLQAVRSLFNYQNYIPHDSLDGQLRELLAMLTSPDRAEFSGVLEIVTTLYGLGSDEMRLEIIRVMRSTVLNNEADRNLRMEVFRCFNALFEYLSLEQQLDIIECCKKLIDGSEFFVAHSAAVFLQQYQFFLRRHRIPLNITSRWDGVAVPVDLVGIRQLTLTSLLSCYMTEDDFNSFCESVFKCLIKSTESNTMMELQSAFLEVLPVLTHSKSHHYLRRLIVAAYDKLPNQELLPNAIDYQAEQLRLLNLFTKCVNQKKISIDANDLCSKLISIVSHPNQSTEMIVAVLEALSVLHHIQETSQQFREILLHMMVHPALMVRENAMFFLNKLYSRACSDDVQVISRYVKSIHRTDLAFLGEMLSGLRNVLSVECFNNIMFHLLNRLDNCDEWSNMKLTQKERIFEALQANLDKMDTHMLVVLMHRLSRIISSGGSLLLTRGLFMTAYDVWQHRLTFDLVKGLAENNHVASPDEVIELLLPHNKRQ